MVVVSVMVVSLVAIVVDAVADGIVVWAGVDSWVEINVLIDVEEMVVEGLLAVFVVIAENISNNITS